MRLLPVPADQISVGIDISIDTVRLVALKQVGLKPVGFEQVGFKDSAVEVQPSSEIDVLSTWHSPCDLLAHDPTQWVDLVCELLQNQLPENTCPRKTRVSLSVPHSWMHFGVGNSEKDAKATAEKLFRESPFFSPAHSVDWSLASSDDALQNQKRVFVSVVENAIVRIAATLDRRGYRLNRVVPDGIAVGATSSLALGIESPCIVMLHRDGGTVTLFDQGKPALVRNLPAITPRRLTPSPLTQSDSSSAPTPAQLKKWREIVQFEIASTLEYYARLSGDWKFADRITEQTPIVFAGSLFDDMQAVGLDRLSLLQQWSVSLDRPVALWSCELAPPTADEKLRADNPEQATALSLAMMPHNEPNPGEPEDPIWNRISLLPPVFGFVKRYETVRLRWVSAMVIAAIVTFMFCVDSYIVQREKFAVQQSRQSTIDPIRSHLRQLTSIENDYRHRLETLASMASFEPTDDALQALAAIADAIPVGPVEMQVTEVDFQTGTFSITGMAPNPQALQRMSDRLRRTRWVAPDPLKRPIDSVIVSANQSDTMASRRHEENSMDLHYDDEGHFRWKAPLGGWVSQSNESEDIQ